MTPTRLPRPTRAASRSAPATLFRRLGKTAVATAFLSGGLATAGVAAADEPTTGELMDQIQQLQQKVEAMNAKETKPAEPKATDAEEGDAVARTVADAEARAAGSDRGIALAPMLQTEPADDPDPFTAGHNGKFLLVSPDGLFSLNPNFQLQVRNVTNFLSTDDALDDFEQGFEIRRFKIGFKGNAFSKDLTYDFKFAFERDGGTAVLENAFIDYTPDFLYGDNFGRGEGALGFRIGQYKDTTFYEEFTSSSRQVAVDRSLVNEAIGGGQTDFIQGVGLLYNSDKLRAIVAYIDGAASSNTNFADNSPGQYGFNARFDYFMTGTQKDFDGFSAIGVKQDSFRFGAGFNFTAAGDEQILYHTADASYKTETGLGLFAAYYGQYAEAGDNDGYNAGGLVQASQKLGDDGWEVFGRYDLIVFDGDVQVGTDAKDNFHELTVGVNKYWQGDKVKMTVDLGYLPNGNPSLGGSKSGIGLRANPGDETDQVYIRGQFQLLL